jgi:putative PIN family toxin of toxin-antitoxin system
MRIVIDTSVLIAALTKPRGAAARIVRTWRAGRLGVVASDATLREAELVLGAGWLARVGGREAVDALLRDLRDRSVRIAAARIEELTLRDEGDRRLVEAAVAGGARYIVTADREVLRMRGYGAVEFVTASELVKRTGL